MSQRYFTSIVFILFAICLIPRVYDLGKFLTADEKRWVANTAAFTKALASRHWNKTIQQPHPGITTQWLGAPTIHSQSWAVRKLPLVIGQSILIMLIGYVFKLLLARRSLGEGWVGAALLVLLLALDPFLIAHTRVYAMDSLLAQFLLLSAGLLLLWDKTQETRYLVFAGMAAAFAVLSKVPGILIVPFSVVYLLLTPLSRPKAKVASIWLVAFTLTAILLLPAIIADPYRVWDQVSSFFSSADYESQHTAPATYYIGSLLFFSTPLQMLALVLFLLNLTPSLSFVRRGSLPPTAKQVLTLLLFALLFFLMMSFGAKKGDRYILPVFVFLDAVAAIVISSTVLNIESLKITWKLNIKNWKFWGALITLLLIFHLGWLDYTIHPYYLAYVNPLTKPFFGERRLGWGEGLELAAEYLNTKPNPDKLKVATYYPTEFSYGFKGEAVPVHQWEEDSVNYVVLYRAMLDRGLEAYETDILNHFQQKTPERVFKLGGLDYVWVYKKDRS